MLTLSGESWKRSRASRLGGSSRGRCRTSSRRWRVVRRGTTLVTTRSLGTKGLVRPSQSVFTVLKPNVTMKKINDFRNMV